MESMVTVMVTRLIFWFLWFTLNISDASLKASKSNGYYEAFATACRPSIKETSLFSTF
jgi:hypothetical protein